MGCDIHIYTEKKSRDGKWFCTDLYRVNPYFDPNDDNDWEQEYEHVDFYNGRNYELFGALAGVRSDIPHIEPKGVPDDASKECKADYERWDTDAHTPSWLTLEELKKHRDSLGNTIKRSGMLSPKQIEELKKGVKPDHWCGWTSAKDYQHAEWEDGYNPLDNFIDELYKFLEFRFYNYEIKAMEDSDFRVVFWFDN